MSTKRSKDRFKRALKEWTRYVGRRASLSEYAAQGAPYLDRLRRDLTAWWVDHPDPAKRLTPEQVEEIAHRLADLLDEYPEPITPSGIIQQFYDEWSKFADHPAGAGMSSRMSQMVPASTETPGNQIQDEEE